MNILNWLCCTQSPKPPQQKPIIRTAATFQQQQSHKKMQWRQPSSQPFNLADKYKGQQLKGIPNGNGQMMYKNGDYYRGQWVNGQKQGRGLQIYNQKGCRYEGEWKGNLPNGQGKITYDEDGSYFIGEFKDNIKHGKGQLHDASNQKVTEQLYQNGVLKKQKVKEGPISRQQQFPTLVLDKQRFNSQDLQNFQRQNPQIKQLQISFLMKYYSICRIIKLAFVKKHIKQWDDKEVRQFLESIGLVQCKQSFYKNKIKGKNLLTLSQKQMKEDLKMKLGERKRLGNYCKFLGQIYNQQKKKKENKKNQSYKPITNQRRSTDIFSRQNKFKTAYVDQQHIIQEQNQFDSENQSFANTNSRSKKDRQKKQDIYLPHGFETEEWVQFYSNQVHSMTQTLANNFMHEDLQIIPKSQKSSSSASKNSMAGSIVKNLSRKKSKEDQDQDFLSNNLPQKIKNINSQTLFQHENQISLHQIQHQKHDQKGNNDAERSKQQKKSSSSSSSSDNSSSDDLPELNRKKTMGVRCNKEGGMQIRELYQFLKEKGNLQFIIKQRQIQMLELIGQGGYGKVYKGKYISCPVAVKDYIKTGKHQQSQQDFLKQLQILSGLKHPNIVLYMGICITTDKYQLVTEYLQNGSLFDQIHKKKKAFTKQQIYQMVDDMTKGMVYLHNMKNILHRDLKSSNVLLDQDWKVKLCDFGLSGHKKKSKKKNKGRVGTYQWMAPQVMRKQQMDFFSDVYSFGVIIWQLLANKIPYDGYTQHQIIGEVGYDDNYKLRFDTHNSMWREDDFIVQLMDQCLNRVASQRPTFIEIQSKLNQYFERLAQIKQKSLSI